MPSQLTCRELVDFLAEYVEGRLPQDELARFNAHLAGCPACVRHARSYETTLRLERVAFRDAEEGVPDDVPEELVQAILATRDREA